MDFSLIGFGVSILQKIADFGLGKAQSAAFSKLKQSESVIVKQLLANIQPDMDELKNKIESFAEAHLKASMQYVQEALIMSTGVSEVLNVKLVMEKEFCYLDMPVAAKKKLRMAENYAKLIFYDKKNMKPSHRLEAIKMQLFCTMILCQDNPQQCVNLMDFQIGLLGNDLELRAAIKKCKFSNVPMIGNKQVIESMRQFYTQLRYGLCSLSIMRSKHADFSSIIKTMNDVFLDQNTLILNRMLGTDGLVLVNIWQGRPVLLAVNSSFQYAPEENLLVVMTFDFPDADFDLKNLTPLESSISLYKDVRAQLLFDTNIEMQTESLRFGLNKVIVPLLDSTPHTFHATGQGKKRRVFKTWKNNVVAINLDSGIEEDSNGAYQLIVKWGNDRSLTISPIPDDIPTSSKNVHIEDYEIVQVIESENDPGKIYVDIHARSDFQQTIFRIMCDSESGVQFEEIKGQFSTEKSHMVRWSQKNARYEVIEGNAGASDEISMSRVDASENCLIEKASLQEVVNEFLKRSGAKSSFYYVDCLVLEDYIFVSIGDR